MKTLVRFVRSEHGSTAIEYGLIAGAMCIALIATLPQLASSLDAAFARIIPPVN